MLLERLISLLVLHGVKSTSTLQVRDLLLLKDEPDSVFHQRIRSLRVDLGREGKCNVLLRSACVAAKSRTAAGFRLFRVAGGRKLGGSGN
jgi:hypothetical protein